MCSYILLISYLNIVICDDITHKKHCGVSPRLRDNMLVAPSDGVHCASNDSRGKRVIYLHILIDFRHLMLVYGHVATAYA